MYIIISIVTFFLGGLLVWLTMRFLLKSRYESVLREAEKEAEVIKKNKLLEVKEKFIHLKADLEKQVSQRNAKIQSVETKLKQREMNLSQRQEELQRKNAEVEVVKENLASQLDLVEKKKQELEKLHLKEIEHLETLSGLSADEAKERLIESLKDEAKSEAASYINDIMEEAKMTANKEAKKIVIQSIQRVATETAIENSITVFHIESDEIKGRIIGREGRNIRSLEQLLGVDLIIDDTPEVITVSCFDPIRREIARRSLDYLIQDGRIQPGRIEEVVEKVKNEIQTVTREAGQEAAFKLGLPRINKELLEYVGRLKFRTSYGQNAYQHSMEVAYLCGMMASELGLDPNIAKRCGLLHDIGKSADFELDGSHVEVGVRLAKKYGEPEVVINAIESHHGDVEPKSVYAVLTQAADTLSAARPGARSEILENYVKRIEQLEEICKSYDGVYQSYAMQSGREVRVMVVPDKIDDIQAFKLAREIRERIENEMTYPGQIKVSVIREYRAVETAK